MRDDDRSERSEPRTRRVWPSLGRRRALRVIGFGAVGAFVGVTLAKRAEDAARDRRGADKIAVTPTCVACFGCIAVCPTAAIEVRTGSITVDQDACVSCGYCQAGCAVDGIRVLRDDAHG